MKVLVSLCLTTVLAFATQTEEPLLVPAIDGELLELKDAKPLPASD